MGVALGDRLLELAGPAPDADEDATLADLLAGLAPRHVEAVQPRDDLVDAVRWAAAPGYGDEIAEAAAEELAADPMVPTSNHYGVDTFADSVQGTFLFALRPGAETRRTVVVLSFGSISLNNLTYPMGLRLYDLGPLPQRLPVFPNRLKHCTVSAAPPFDAAMVERATSRLRRMGADGEITPFCERAAEEVLDEVFGAPGTLAAPNYGEQSVRVNGDLWRRMFGDGSTLVQLQIEPIAARLLAADLADPSSLAARVILDGPTRTRLLANLDGARACWRSDGGGGTEFFWGVAPDGRRVALRAADIDLTPAALVDALATGTLLPSLFTCFLVLAFARGLVCVGGYYQRQYLPVMQAGIVDALDEPEVAARVAAVPTDVCLAGVQGIARVMPDRSVIPAGPVEIAGAGGLTDTDVAALGSVTVRDARLVAFTELFHHLVPDATLPPDWVSRLAAENGRRCLSLVRLDKG